MICKIHGISEAECSCPQWSAEAFVGFGRKSLCPCGKNCPLVHVPLRPGMNGRHGVMDWGDGFRTTMLPECEARKAWAGDYPEDLQKPTPNAAPR